MHNCSSMSVVAGEKGRKGDKLICKQQKETNCSKFEPVWFVAEVEELNCSERNSGRGPGSRDTGTRETDGLESVLAVEFV